MKGYPKFVATKQDFLNLLSTPDCKAQALADLQAICDMNDDKMLTTTTRVNPDDPMSDWHTAEIDNPMPMWRQKGFVSKKEVEELILLNGGEA
jgi:hypothetical protein